jgi:plastocyanin
MFSRAEIFGFVIAVLGVSAMGVITFTGPYHHFNKVPPKILFAPVHVQIVTDPKTIGRYTPHTITVHVGQSIIFTNVSNADHTVTADNNVFASPNISLNSSWTFTPKHAGTFHYYCIYHPFMHGVLVVKA